MSRSKRKKGIKKAKKKKSFWLLKKVGKNTDYLFEN